MYLASTGEKLAKLCRSGRCCRRGEDYRNRGQRSRCMSRRTAGRQAGVALFPFVAVLLCTMGALIVLLLTAVQARIGAKSAAAKAIAQQSQEASEAADQIQQATDDTLLRNDQLNDQLAELQKMLSDKRLEMSAIEEHIRKVEDDLKRLQALGKEIIARAQSNDVASADEKLLDELREKIEDKKKELDDARKLAAKKKPAFSIVPYEGPNGTNRRPIFVECRIDGVILQPEGVVLTPNDFEGPMGPGNPLDAALRAVREHWKNNGLEGEPYPLIVVRPSGAIAYMKSRSAMSHWENEFGYELVEEEVELKFPKPDPALETVVKRALKDARERQAVLIASMPRRFGNSQVGDSFEADSLPGEEDLSGGGGGGRGPGGSGTGGAGGGSGSGSGVGSKGKGMGSSGRPGTGIGSGSGLPSSNTAASSAYGSAASKLRGGPGMGGGTGGDGSGGMGTASRIGATSVNGGSGTGGSGTGSSATATSNAGNGSSTGGSKGASSANGRPGGTGGSGGDPNMSGNVSAGGTQGTGAMNGSAGQSSGSAGASGMSGGSAAVAQDMRSQQTQSASLEYRPDVDKAKATSSKLTRQKGEGWGLKGTGAMGSGGTRMSDHPTSVSRPIQVRCTRSQVVVMPDRDDTRRASVVQLPGDLASNLDPFMAAVRKRVEFWGPPVDGGYWKPVLNVDVAPDAEERYQELTALLQGSGFDVQRKVKR